MKKTATHIDTTTYTLPNILLDESLFSRQIEDASHHIKALKAQMYAFKIMDMFEENPDIEMIQFARSDEDDNYIIYVGVELRSGADGARMEDAMEGYFEHINDTRDSDIHHFIDAILGEEEFSRDDLHDTISGAYNQLRYGNHKEDWDTIVNTRKSFQEARELDEATPPGAERPRARI